MPGPKLSKLELQIMETLWTRGESSIREIQEAFPAKGRPAYTTVQTTIYRMETKGVLRRVRKVGNFHIFAAAISRNSAQRRLVDDLLALFGGRTQPVMAHLIESGKLTLDDVKDAEKALRKLERKEKP
jgi:BlaI family penicillinase repressor